MEEMNDHYIVADLYSAAALVADGHQPSRVMRLGNSSRVSWVFPNDNGQITQAIENYWNGTLKVSARAFVNAIYELRRQIDALKDQVNLSYSQDGKKERIDEPIERHRFENLR